MHEKKAMDYRDVTSEIRAKEKDTVHMAFRGQAKEYRQS